MQKSKINNLFGAGKLYPDGAYLQGEFELLSGRPSIKAEKNKRGYTIVKGG